MCFKVLKQFADKQTLTRDLSIISLLTVPLLAFFQLPGGQTSWPSLLPRVNMKAAIFGRFRLFLARICGKWYVLHANNMLFVLLIQQKASMASPVCGLQGKSHTHPPRFLSLARWSALFRKFFYFFSPRVLTGTNCRFMIWCYS